SYSTTVLQLYSCGTTATVAAHTQTDESKSSTITTPFTSIMLIATVRQLMMLRVHTPHQSSVNQQAPSHSTTAPPSRVSHMRSKSSGHVSTLNAAAAAAAMNARRG